MRRSILLTILGSVIVSAGLVMLRNGQSVSAIDESLCRGLTSVNLQRCRNARNFNEGYSAHMICDRTSRASICGALWASYPGTGHFNDTIPEIDANASSVTLELRGSASPGERSARGYVYAREVTMMVEGRQVITNSWLYRGDTGKTGNYAWTSDQVDYPDQNRIRFQLDVSSVAPGTTKTFSAQVYRRFAYYDRSRYNDCVVNQGGFNAATCPVSASGTGEWQTVSIRVTKKPAPTVYNYNYDLEPSVSVNTERVEEDDSSVHGISANVVNKGTTKTDDKVKKYAAARYVIRSGAHIGELPAGSGVAHSVGNEGDICGVVLKIAVGRFSPQHCKPLRLFSNSNQVAENASVNIVNAAQDDIAGLKLQQDDMLCYVSMVSSYHKDVGEDVFRYSKSKCISTSKKPKVQVWGGDAKTNGEVLTGVTTQKNVRDETKRINDAATLQSMGLWRTGVDNNGNQLGDDAVDRHWSIICSQDYKGGSGNQKAFNASNNPAWLPACNNNANNLTTEYQARVILQRGSMIGNYTCRNSPPPAHYIGIMGSIPTTDKKNLCGKGPWERSSTTAKWIGLNVYGQHTLDTGWQDPSYLVSVYEADRALNYGNIYVFRLKNVTFGELKDAKKLTLNFSGAVDNLVKVKLNGYDMDVNAQICSSCPYGKYKNSDWALPGWSHESYFNADMQPGTVVKSTGNVIDFYIKSDATHIGLLIDNISLTHTSDQTYQTTYGSWGEYGIAAKDRVSSASGAGLSSGYAGRENATVAEYNRLTFANTPNFGNFTTSDLVLGNFAIPSVSGARGAISGTVAVDSLTTGEYTARDVTLTGSTLSSGKSVVIKATGTVKIAGNILYADSADPAKLPQVIIHAKNIIIEPDVTEVNAWLVTRNDGYVSTCGAVVNMTTWLSGVSATQCNKQLKVNGPIMAGSLLLRRTYGGQHATAAKNDDLMHPGTPAEILNLRADTYLWAYNNYHGRGVIRTMNLKELPPRY